MLDEQLELSRLEAALERAARREWLHVTTPARPSGFPLLVERLNNRMSNETVLERIQRMQEEAIRREGSGA